MPAHAYLIILIALCCILFAMSALSSSSRWGRDAVCSPLARKVYLLAWKLAFLFPLGRS